MSPTGGGIEGHTEVSQGWEGEGTVWEWRGRRLILAGECNAL